MGRIEGEIKGGTPPYGVVIRESGESTGNRCVGSCDSLPANFTEDSGNNSYYFIVTDSGSCVFDSRDIANGEQVLNCDVVQPTFIASMTQPVCLQDGTYSQPYIHLDNISDATRYIICYNSTTMDCQPCAQSTGLMVGNSMNIPILASTTTGAQGVLIRIYNGDGCDVYKQYFDTLIYPSCQISEVPDFGAGFVQPYCSSSTGGTIVNGTLKLTGITHATRYKICEGLTFTCNSSCTVSDGNILGSSMDIPITSPAEGVVKNVTIRLYNGTGCNSYKDYSFAVSGPKCSSNQINMSSVDIQFNLAGNDVNCANPSVRTTDFDMYFTPNTPGMVENGQKSLSKANFERNIPNGNDVPNIYVSASLELNCGPGPFYRWFFNLALLRAKYPAINIFTFDLYVRRSKGTDNLVLRPTINDQANVSLIKVATPQTTYCDGTPSGGGIYNNTDVGRLPCYNGIVKNVSVVTYGIANVGYKKLGTVSWNITTNSSTWVAV